MPSVLKQFYLARGYIWVYIFAKNDFMFVTTQEGIAGFELYPSCVMLNDTDMQKT